MLEVQFPKTMGKRGEKWKIKITKSFTKGYLLQSNPQVQVRIKSHAGLKSLFQVNFMKKWSVQLVTSLQQKSYSQKCNLVKLENVGEKVLVKLDNWRLLTSFYACLLSKKKTLMKAHYTQRAFASFFLVLMSFLIAYPGCKKFLIPRIVNKKMTSIFMQKTRGV